MDKRFKKIYIEITNICNLNCRFCPKTKRSGRFMSAVEFSIVLDKIKPYTDYIYLHLMGEPLLHPELETILGIAAAKGFRTCITTNGTLLEKQLPILMNADSIHKISISLQAKEGNENGLMQDDYIESCAAAGKELSEKTITAFRLWNIGGADSKNEEIIAKLREYFPEEWEKNKSGYKLKDKAYLEIANVFDWPGEDAEELPERDHYYCYALNDQAGILSDGTVVPCCLDHEGELVLGNIFTDNPEDVFSGPRATAIKKGFEQGKASEKMCRNCGYASRF